MGGLIVGAEVPILLISRSASAQEVMNSIALGTVMAQSPEEREER